MTQWDYLRVPISDRSTPDEKAVILNAAGREGWELVCIAGDEMERAQVFYLKRPLNWQK